MSVEILLAIIGLILFVASFFVPHRHATLVSAGGTALGLALVAAWLIPG